MRILDLDELLGNRYPEASFHDAQLAGFSVDLEHTRAEFRFRVVTALDDSEPIRRPGRLLIDGLAFFASEAPRTPCREWGKDSRWITSDGPFPGPNVRSTIVAPNMPADVFCHYFFASDTNSFIVVAGRAARFVWEDTPLPHPTSEVL